MPTGLTQDAGWEIGVSRTIHRPPQAVWEFITGPLPTEKGAPYLLRFHEERLVSAAEREERRTYWKGVLDRVVAELA
ncbi:hypothetical protein [Streptomyces sp. 2R]|uniref:hypothetical protein n=1 Tax=Streptomyces sp. 2R TaxID=1883452 RepID=UPI000B91C998|nr:hypothetical protein [Streptomyces sp. 2R]OXY99400.1 hypothetical protein BEH93_04990 [Streptomyces sp. 2R]